MHYYSDGDKQILLSSSSAAANNLRKYIAVPSHFLRGFYSRRRLCPLCDADADTN